MRKMLIGVVCESSWSGERIGVRAVSCQGSGLRRRKDSEDLGEPPGLVGLCGQARDSIISGAASTNGVRATLPLANTAYGSLVHSDRSRVPE